MVSPEVIAGLEYGVAVLGIKALLVLGHSGAEPSRRLALRGLLVSAPIRAVEPVSSAPGHFFISP
jgi:hypothetical protein